MAKSTVSASDSASSAQSGTTLKVHHLRPAPGAKTPKTRYAGRGRFVTPTLTSEGKA